MLRRIYWISLCAILVVIFGLSVISIINNLYIKSKKINTEQYLNSNIDLASVYKKDYNRRDYKKNQLAPNGFNDFYQSKINLHFLITEDIIRYLLADFNNPNIIKKDLSKNFVRIMGRWEAAVKNNASDVWTKWVYYIYVESPCNQGKLFLSIASITPVLIIEYQLAGEDAPNHTEVYEDKGDNGEKNYTEALVNCGFIKDGKPNKLWYLYSRNNRPNIDDIKLRLMKGFCIQQLSKKY